MYPTSFFGEVIWRCNSCFVSPSISMFLCYSVCVSYACVRSMWAWGLCTCRYVHRQPEDDTGERDKLWWIPAESYVPDVKFSVSHPSVCQCSQWAPKGVVSMEGWAAEAHSRWHCSRRQTPVLVPYQHHITLPPLCNFRALMGLEQVKWIRRKLPSSQSQHDMERAGGRYACTQPILIEWVECEGSRLKRLCDIGLEPQAGNAVGLKLEPVFLISSDLFPLDISQFLTLLFKKGRSTARGVAMGGTSPPPIPIWLALLVPWPAESEVVGSLVPWMDYLIGLPGAASGHPGLKLCMKRLLTFLVGKVNETTLKKTPNKNT